MLQSQADSNIPNESEFLEQAMNEELVAEMHTEDTKWSADNDESQSSLPLAKRPRSTWVDTLVESYDKLASEEARSVVYDGRGGFYARGAIQINGRGNKKPGFKCHFCTIKGWENAKKRRAAEKARAKDTAPQNENRIKKGQDQCCRPLGRNKYPMSRSLP